VLCLYHPTTSALCLPHRHQVRSTCMIWLPPYVNNCMQKPPEPHVLCLQRTWHKFQLLASDFSCEMIKYTTSRIDTSSHMACVDNVLRFVTSDSSAVDVMCAQRLLHVKVS
jgi:hypothetical protein